MRSPTILDIVQAVTDVGPSHPEVAVWWYARGGKTGAPLIQLVLEPQGGMLPNMTRIGSELAARLGAAFVAVRLHRGAAEAPVLYRVLTTGDSRTAAGHPGGM